MATLPEKPLTRYERYLAAIAGQGEAPAQPVTREEQYLGYIAENGTAGGGGGGVAGVSSFNGRTGAVMPKSGDYSAADVGAVPIERTVDGKSLANDINILPTGGAVGQVLTKSSAANYAVKWEDQLSIEEYDETISDVEWHVRKWFNGFCELSGKVATKKIELSDWGNVGEILYYVDYVTGSLNKALPITLKKRYSFNYSISGDSNTMYGTYATTTSTYNPLTQIPAFAVYRINAKAGTWVIYIHITGCWKDIVSTVSAKMQDDIASEELQGDVNA